MQVYLDESGYSGANLLDANSVFVLASNNLDDKTAKSVIDRCFGVGQAGTELKWVHVREHQTEGLLELIKTLRKNPDNFFFTAVHKRFTALVKLVDFWLEPAIREATGLDFYEKRASLAFSNLSYATLLNLGGKRFLYDHLSRFQTMMEQPTEANYKNFWGELKKSADELKGPVQDILQWFLFAEEVLTSKRMEILSKLRSPLELMDAVFTVEMESISHWSDASADPVELFHDHASEFEKVKWLWDAVTSKDAPPIEFFATGKVHKFPLNVRTTNFVDSKDFLQVQISDLLAGAIAETLRGQIGDHHDPILVEQMMTAGLGDFKVWFLWPSSDPAEFVPFDDNAPTPESREYITDLIMNAIESKKGKKLNLSVTDQIEAGRRAFQRSDYKEALRYIKPLAEQGLPFFESLLAEMFSEGLGVGLNQGQAIKWWRKAAESGEPNAHYHLGHHFATAGPDYNPTDALKFTTFAAEQGLAGAMHNLACFYHKGLEPGVPRDDKQAFFWASQAAEKGYAKSQSLLGSFYHNALGTTKDLGKAAHWWSLSANQGNADSQFNLGLAFLNGRGVSKDFNEGIVWLRKAADAGDKQATLVLAKALLSVDAENPEAAERLVGIRKTNAEADNILRKLGK